MFSNPYHPWIGKCVVNLKTVIGGHLLLQLGPEGLECRLRELPGALRLRRRLHRARAPLQRLLRRLQLHRQRPPLLLQLLQPGLQGPQGFLCHALPRLRPGQTRFQGGQGGRFGRLA